MSNPTKAARLKTLEDLARFEAEYAELERRASEITRERPTRWDQVDEVFPSLVRLRDRARSAARKAFLAERLSELSTSERPATREEREDLDRRLLAAATKSEEETDQRAEQRIAERMERGEPVEVAVKAAQEEEIASLPAPPTTKLYLAEVGALTTHLEGRIERQAAPNLAFWWHTYRLELAALWPSVLAEWLKARPQAARSYRFPLAASSFNRALAGKRHGRAHGLPAGVDTDESGAIVRISVAVPRGAQLELGAAGKITLKANAYDKQGNLKPEAITGLISKVTGPQVAMIGHVAFALAHKHAAEEGRTADGRFWFTPSEVGDLLGYRRESNGKASKNRIGRDATKTIRKNFATYAQTELRQVVKLKDESTHTINGPLLYPTLKTHTERRPGQKGRDRRAEWQIRPELWSLIYSRYIAIPVELLHRGDVPADAWAHCIRVYEVLASKAVNDKAKAALGQAVVSFEWLEEEANLLGASVRPDVGRARMINWLERLAERGALTFERVDLKKGPGIRYALPEERRAELAAVAGKAAKFKALEANAAKPKRRRR